MSALLHSAPTHAAEPVRLLAAGSLREPLSEVARLFEAREGVRVEARFGASGLLRDEIAAGARADVFASANMEHPASLAAAGRFGPAVLFARNRLCALARPGLDVTGETLIDRMLDEGVRLGTSTPGADPSGDYAWAAFRRIDQVRPGSFDRLAGKALQLTGRGGPAAAGGRSLYGALIAEGGADLFLTYCTNALVAVREVPGARSLDLPGPDRGRRRLRPDGAEGGHAGGVPPRPVPAPAGGARRAGAPWIHRAHPARGGRALIGRGTTAWSWGARGEG